MTAPQTRRITTRGKYVGMLETNAGLCVYFRLEHRLTTGKWVSAGPLMQMVMSDDQVVGEAWYNALASSAERAMLRARMETHDQEEMLPGIG